MYHSTSIRWDVVVRRLLSLECSVSGSSVTRRDFIFTAQHSNNFRSSTHNQPETTTLLSNTHGLQRSSHHRSFHHVPVPRPLLRRLLLHDRVRSCILSYLFTLY